MRAARIDRNQPEIVAALRGVGFSVQPLHMVGGGCPDLAVGDPNRCPACGERRNWMLEVKSTHAEDLTPAQIKWHTEWRGQVQVVTNVAEALAAVGVTK